ncbi:glutamate 5-kinase [Acidaminococcus sp.]|uniref:glutamate 5-kinase n=1 Tax=Acidaminococcus sp. TaxID=1872103 RepID=UPI003D7CAADF
MERKKIAEAKRIVVKVGTSTITYPNGKINYEKIEKMARILTDFQNQGKEMLLVSSGAGAAGVGRMGLEAKPGTIPGKQACAAVGQGILMHIYERIFGEYGQVVAQVLLTKNDMANQHSYANARNALQEMISWGVIPIINENDVVAIDEFKIGDNDNLSALVASLADADLDILLSDIDGLYTANPKTHPDARLVSVVEEVTPEIEATAGGAGSRNATGGMLTKLQAAKNAMSAGIALIIANGEHLEILRDILRGEPVGTLFVPKESHLRFRNQWVAFGSKINGRLIVDAGLSKALRQKGSCSILPVGIVSVEGEFDSGDTVSVVDQEGHELARGMTNYGSEDVALIKGCKTSQIEDRIGYKHYDEVIHRDNLVIL